MTQNAFLSKANTNPPFHWIFSRLICPCISKFLAKLWQNSKAQRFCKQNQMFSPTWATSPRRHFVKVVDHSSHGSAFSYDCRLSKFLRKTYEVDSKEDGTFFSHEYTITCIYVFVCVYMYIYRHTHTHITCHSLVFLSAAMCYAPFPCPRWPCHTEIHVVSRGGPDFPEPLAAVEILQET